jgi:hypothetical protein
MVGEADTVTIDGAWFRRTIAYLVEQSPRCGRANTLVTDALVTDVADAAAACFVTLLVEDPRIPTSLISSSVRRTL